MNVPVILLVEDNPDDEELTRLAFLESNLINELDVVRDLIQRYTRHANSYIRKPVDFAQFTEVVKQLGLDWLVLNETPAGWAVKA